MLDNDVNVSIYYCLLKILLRIMVGAMKYISPSRYWKVPDCLNYSEPELVRMPVEPKVIEAKYLVSGIEVCPRFNI